ncbi:hypothetical protein B0H19DRAFT_1277493 [Mycena capillaripes]|nr:hypothetical protein B0H19DRAFT_1277493 [Mycena capillaripes]
MAVNACTVVVLLGSLSEWFNPGESTIYQQTWDLELDTGVVGQIRLGAFTLAFYTPAIRLFVVVGQMIRQYGICTKV